MSSVRLAAAVALAVLAARPARAGFVDYTAVPPGTYLTLTTGAGTADEVTATGTAAVTISPVVGLGVAGGGFEEYVDSDGGEAVRFAFARPAGGVVLSFVIAGSADPSVPGAGYGVVVDGFAPDGTPLGSRAADLLPTFPTLDVSALFAGAPLGAAVLTPTDRPGSDVTFFSVATLRFSAVSEPASAALVGVAAGVAGLARRVRGRAATAA